ncbi:MAG: hypothetical protein HYZ81_11735 [Nitrospinae bacterium]|nr:hypothetical protein [Nitrospinota bacterium]
MYVIAIALAGIPALILSRVLLAFLVYIRRAAQFPELFYAWPSKLSGLGNVGMFILKSAWDATIITSSTISWNNTEAGMHLKLMNLAFFLTWVIFTVIILASPTFHRGFLRAIVALAIGLIAGGIALGADFTVTAGLRLPSGVPLLFLLVPPLGIPIALDLWAASGHGWWARFEERLFGQLQR